MKPKIEAFAPIPSFNHHWPLGAGYIRHSSGN